MKYKTTDKNEVYGEGKILAWQERAGAYFVGDLQGDGVGDIPTVNEATLDDWLAKGWVVEYQEAAQ